MPVNALAREAGFKLGPLVLGTLVTHYFDRIKNDTLDGKSMTQLRQDELLYDAAFNIVRAFLEVASNHTVEEVQGFANTRTPSPPWVHVVRLMIPMSCCDEAASHLIKALGGEEVAMKTVGGVKWWQVRGIRGVDAQWITAKKDWREAKRRHKMQEKPNVDEHSKPSGLSSECKDPPVYEEEMDEMRCILYSHGGGYYFGSVDQERYSIQRHARKINGRVFAVNYRLAPQYPFPCALQDLVAAYIFLIKPPLGASHQPVKPAHIVIAGDSAGGGISLALLQVIRDTGLPMPAGGVLISPWCDLTHSFPSVYTNTATDVIPSYGLSLQKPSVLWPPPSEEMSNRVHAGLRSRIRQTLRLEEADVSSTQFTPEHHGPSPSTNAVPVDVGTTAHLPPLTATDHQKITLVTQSGDTLTIDQQVHLYTQNSLLAHPLISSALSYLGGLPPLLFIASDKEVLRDEIIYAAHKAAHPERYPIREEARALYPSLIGIESRHRPTPVHLQVYDDTAHVLPVLFSFTTPGKYCYRAIATFCKHVTGMNTIPQSPVGSKFRTTSLSPPDMKIRKQSSSGSSINRPRAGTSPGVTERSYSRDENSFRPGDSSEPSSKLTKRKSLRRSLSVGISRAIRRKPHSHHTEMNPEGTTPHETMPPLPDREHSNGSSDVGGPRFPITSSLPQEQIGDGIRYAGDGIVYSETSQYPSWNDQMIRERVSTQGVIRPVEPEAELDVFSVPPELIGTLSEVIMRRYIDSQAKFEKKYSGTIKTIEKHRRHNLERAKKDNIWNIGHLQNFLAHDEKDDGGRKGETPKGIKEGLAVSSGSWTWAWALDGGERPPPSSIAARRDTDEARQLARIADHAALHEDHSFSGNNLWTVVINFLTANPDKPTHTDKDKAVKNYEGNADESAGEVTPEKRRSRFSRFLGSKDRDGTTTDN